MEDTTAPAESALESTFHPDFNTYSTGDIILRSSDNVDFYFSKSLLVGISAIFRDTCSLHVTSHAESPRIFELPTATSEGLSFVLSLLANSLRGQEIPIPDLFGLSRILDTAIPIIEAYDLGAVFGLMKSHYQAETYELPLAQFTLAVLAGDKRLVAVSAEKSLRYRLFNLRPVEHRRIFSSLRKWRPDAALKLYVAHDEYMAALEEFKLQLPTSGLEFACERDGGVCITMQRFNSNGNMYDEMLQRAIQNIIQTPSPALLITQITGLANALIECDDCRDAAMYTIHVLHQNAFGRPTPFSCE